MQKQEAPRLQGLKMSPGQAQVGMHQEGRVLGPGPDGDAKGRSHLLRILAGALRHTADSSIGAQQHLTLHTGHTGGF